MNFEEFFEEARRKRLSIVFKGISETPKLTYTLDNESLFHIPLIALSILVMAKTKRKPRPGELGQLVGDCFERSIRGFKGSDQQVAWSLNLRIRVAHALDFLVIANLAAVDGENNKVTATTLGSKVVKAATSNNNNLSYTLKVVERNYLNICRERQIRMRV